jgi:hypothetical protein
MQGQAVWLLMAPANLMIVLNTSSSNCNPRTAPNSYLTLPHPVCRSRGGPIRYGNRLWQLGALRDHMLMALRRWLSLQP